MSNLLRSELVNEVNKSINESTHILKLAGNSTKPMGPTISNDIPTATISTGTTQISQESPSTVPLVKSRRASSSSCSTSLARAGDDSAVLITDECSTPVDVQLSSTTTPSSDSADQIIRQLLSSWEQPIRIKQPIIFESCEKNLKRKRDRSPSGPSQTDSVGNGLSTIGSSSSPKYRNDPIDFELPQFGADSTHQLPCQLAGERNVDMHYQADDQYGLNEDEKKEDEDDVKKDGSNHVLRLVERAPNQASSTTTAAATTTGWDYKTWTDSSGERRLTAGALLPQGYTLHDDPQFPWICPVRSCRATFGTLTGLGSHFSLVHRASLLNDNEDGTLSVVKKVTGRIPASVVSKKPLDREEPPMATPYLTYTSRYKVPGGATSTSSQTDLIESISKRAHDKAPSSPMVGSPTTRPPLGESGMGFWKYIQSKLVHTPLYPIPRRGHVLQLLQHLPRIRNVEFNPHALKPFRESRDQDISAMIIQAAGKRAKVPCGRCRMGKGPFRGCYVIPTSAPLSLRQSILGCANCFYQCCQTYCDLKRWSLKTYPELKSIRPSRGAVIPPLACITTDEKQPERRSIRVILKKSLAASKHTRNSPRPSLRSSRMKSVLNTADMPLSPTLSAVSPSQMSELEELETWEIAPGRIRGDEQSDAIHNFAFSNAYLAQNQVVRIGRDISFQVVTVKPGTIYSWEASNDDVRLCSIASGKLHVRIHGQEFSMGPNGMVRIKPGAGCTVMNMLYIDAMVHVATVPGDLC